MSAQTQATATPLYTPAVPMHEKPAWYIRGVVFLLITLVLMAVVAVSFWQSAVQSGALRAVFIIVAVVLIIVASVLLRGLTVVAPGRAHVVQLFGNYKGTIRTPGMQFVNPFAIRIPVSTRIRNLETAQTKVNDDAGNPIETAEEITEKLTAELNQRVLAAGVQVIETRLTRLSYAAEIAQAMLRQQQASAVVGARAKIVEGAVGMVKMALERLDEENVVELDEERKAAMVSNLLVVLCSEQATQQVVNTGSLYS